MAHKQHGATTLMTHIVHLSYRLLLELCIAHCEHLIDHKDLGFKEGGNCEAEADCHAGGVTLDGGVEVALYACEIDDLIELAGDLVLGHAHDGAVHVDVLAAGHLGVEAGADFEEGGDAALVLDAAGAGRGDVREELEEGALAGAILADDAKDFALLYLEGDVTEGPDVVGGAFLGAVVGLTDLEEGVFFAEDGHLPPAVKVVTEGAGADAAEAVHLTDVLEFYCGHIVNVSSFKKFQDSKVSGFKEQRVSRF